MNKTAEFYLPCVTQKLDIEFYNINIETTLTVH